LHNFGHGKDGALPYGGLIDANGTLYGTTVGGGTYASAQCATVFLKNGTCGTVYSLDTATGTERVLHSFGATGDGASPFGGLIEANGTIYGTTDQGPAGSSVCGTIFSMSTTGASERVLWSFQNTPVDGCNPFGNLLYANGTIYGTTCCGGKFFNGPCQCREGTVFSFDTATGEERMMHSFGGRSGGTKDGGEPEASVIMVNGMLYGTTGLGGSGCGKYGCGTVYSLSPSGSNYSLVYRFTGGDDGWGPGAALLAAGGSLYGTTGNGGAYGLGTAFRLAP
jgi:uncharacterized repeat protein (TIGR03803 family)